MSYYSGYGGYSGLTSSYSSYGSSSSYRSGRSSLTNYSSSNYDSYSWRKTSAYTPKTYDFGNSSYLTSSTDRYSTRYDEYSWKAKDLLTDNPENKEVDIQLKEIDREKLKFTSVTDKEEKKEQANIEDERKDKDSYKNYLSMREDNSKDETALGGSSYVVKETYGKNDLKDTQPKEDNSRDGSSDIFKGYYTKDYSRDDDKSTRKDSNEIFKGLYNQGFYSKYYGSERSREEDKDLKKRDILTENDEKQSRVDSDEVDYNMNFLNDKKDVDSTLQNLSLHEKKTSVPEKKVFNFEEDVQIIKPQKESSLQSGRGDILSNSSHRVTSNKERYSSTKEKPYKSVQPENRTVEKSKSRKDVTDSGPLRMHRQGVAKFVSAIPDRQRYVSSVNYLPDRIELRFVGVPHKQKKMKRCRSITDLYEITVEPDQEKKEQKRIHPWEETIHCRKQDMYDSENEILYYAKPRHEHTKEMYISQYTHHFDTDEPRTHIAGWKCDVEPNGIPHHKSRMCVVRSPVVSDSRRRVPRPKSAPPQLFARPVSPEEPIRSQTVEVVERSYLTIPRKDDDVFFPNDESVTEDVSSIGYAPSDDTSDSSAFFSDPRFQRQPKEPDFGFNKPRLIRLSAEFPGIRNLEKMRRKRQSMGSNTSGDSRPSVGNTPSPRNGEYGFFVALTSDPRKPQPAKRQHRHSHYY